jgi:excisionase family DNA binding protein
MATIINGVPESPLGESLLKPAEVAAAFRVHATTVKKWATAGKLTVIRTPGGHRRYRESEVRALLGIGTAGSRAGRRRSRTRAGR